MKLVWLIFALVCFEVSNGLPHIRQNEQQIRVAVIPDTKTQVILVSPQKVELLDNVKQALQEMEKTTAAPVVEEIEKTTTVPVTKSPENTRRTRRPTREKPVRERPLMQAYLDAKAATSTSTTATPNVGTYITNIENLQIALTGMASDIDAMCNDKITPSTLDPLRNPFIQFLQNITQQQHNLTNTVLQYWATAPGLNLQPLSLQPITPLPTLPPITTLPTLTRVRSLADSETSEVDEKLKGLEMAIKHTIEEILPHMRYIEEFPSETASQDEWEKFNDSIEFVAVRLRNKTIQQVLDKEKTQRLLENYEKYLSAVQVARLYREMENGKDTSEAIKDVIKARKDC